ncbi:unnamed protein product [Chironomus riparius]|uniref:Gustatory receptor n=1 Tax=Chironomus riparius TaxID=315576 RepID=A0A9N9WX77_9DIPT|nr:unnamed protein product [Chironomus riparius]
MTESSVFESKNIFHSSVPLHYLSKFVGLGFYKFNVNGSAFEVHVIHKICFIGSMLIFCLIFLYDSFSSFKTYFGYELEDTESSYLSSVKYIEMIFEMIFAFIIIIFHQNRIQHIQKVLINLNNFDETLKELKWRFLVKNSWKYFLAVIAFVVYIVLAICFQNLKTIMTLYDWFDLIVYQLNLLLYTTVITQFTVSVLAVKARLGVLRRNVKFVSHIAECANNIDSDDLPLATQMQLLMELLKLRPIKITCGFFEINLPLLLSNIVVVGNYLVIICQFEITQQANNSCADTASSKTV